MLVERMTVVGSRICKDCSLDVDLVVILLLFFINTCVCIFPERLVVSDIYQQFLILL